MNVPITSSSKQSANYDLKNAIAKNRLVGVWRLMTGYRRSYFEAFGSVCLAALAKTMTFLLLRYFVDTILGQGHTEMQTLALVASGFVILAAIEGGCTFLAGRLASQTAENVARRLRNYLYDHLQRLSFTYHDKAKTGDLVQRCTSDVDSLRRFFSDQVIGTGRIIIPFVINFVALLSLHVGLGLASVVMIPFITIASAFFFKRISKIYEAFQEQEATLTTTLQENLTGVRVVKAFARQEYEKAKFERDNREKFRRGQRLVGMNSLYWPTSDSLAWVQLLAGLTLAGVMTIQGQITLGTYLAYAGIISQIVWPIRNLGRLIIQMSSGLVSYTRVAEIIKEDREPLTDGKYTPTSDSVRGAIAFQHVDFAYEAPNVLPDVKQVTKKKGAMSVPPVTPPSPIIASSKPVLHDITFACQPGQIVALLGSTGAGKTSLVNLLPRFYEYTDGSITLDGVELKDYSRRYLRSQIGIVEQEPFLFSRTIRENITYGVGRDVADAEVEAAARAAAMHDVIMGFPKGYLTLVGEKGVTLSGGQKQRVALARTLLKNPRILILDDATSSVDPETEGEIRDALDQLMKNRTTFIIAHRIQSVMIADLILVMDKGRIVQQGTHDELVQQEGIYQQIYNLQSRIETELEKELTRVGL